MGPFGTAGRIPVVPTELAEGGKTADYLRAEHGFSALVELRVDGRQRRVLFDAGDVPRARVRGPLGGFADGFRAELERLGYTLLSREYKVNQMARLSRWLEERGLGVGDVDEVRVEAFLTAFGAGRKQTPTAWAMRSLLDWLRA